jgi:hypothetical protein
MQKYWDTIVVGVITFIVVAIILVIKPGYTPVEVTDDVLTPPAAMQENADTEDAAVNEDADGEAETNTE